LYELDMLAKIHIVAGVALVAAMGLSFTAAQNAPASSPIPTEPAKYVVDVEVVSPGPVSNIIPDADVRLTGPGDQKGPKLHYVDSSGHARFLNQAGGKYVVWASAAGFGYGRVELNVPTQTIDALQGVVRVKMTLPVAESIVGRPHVEVAPLVETTPSRLEGQLALIPLPSPAAPPIPPTAQHRNRVARFFSGIGHKLAF
jgi:hypothetical protein